MIRRAVRKNFKAVYWEPPLQTLAHPTILFANHHGWYDGYLMYHVAHALNLRCLDWIEEFDTFPLFRYVGGLPYPKDDASRRAATIRQTVRSLEGGSRSLVIFPDQPLHYPPEIGPMARSLEFLARKVPAARLVPVAINYEFAMHERAEAFIRIGSPIAHSTTLLTDCRNHLVDLLEETRRLVRVGHDFQLLVRGTDSINERWDMRRIKRK
ncbi:MAG TPA: hypothetical protein PKA27_03490 [Fimbriimonadaceae bacterium]|nr:hypothetical protein [Fimbriimonadaceae bacterium]